MFWACGPSPGFMSVSQACGSAQNPGGRKHHTDVRLENPLKVKKLAPLYGPAGRAIRGCSDNLSLAQNLGTRARGTKTKRTRVGPNGSGTRRIPLRHQVLEVSAHVRNRNAFAGSVQGMLLCWTRRLSCRTTYSVKSVSLGIVDRNIQHSACNTDKSASLASLSSRMNY